MRPHIFWTMMCLLIVLATVLFSSLVLAAPGKRIKAAKPVIKLGHAYKMSLKSKASLRPKVLVRIGKPYLQELKSGKK